MIEPAHERNRALTVTVGLLHRAQRLKLVGLAEQTSPVIPPVTVLFVCSSERGLEGSLRVGEPLEIELIRCNGSSILRTTIVKKRRMRSACTVLSLDLLGQPVSALA